MDQVDRAHGHLHCSILSTETRSHSSHTHSHTNLTNILRAGLKWAQTFCLTGLPELFQSPVQMPYFTWARSNSNLGRLKLIWIQMLIFLPTELNSKGKNVHFHKIPYKNYIIYAFGLAHVKFTSKSMTVHSHYSHLSQMWRMAEPISIQFAVQ